MYAFPDIHRDEARRVARCMRAFRGVLLSTRLEVRTYLPIIKQEQVDTYSVSVMIMEMQGFPSL